MPSDVSLVNATKRQTVAFLGIAASKRSEIVAYPPAAAIVAKYLSDNIGDRISFAKTGWGESPFSDISFDELDSWPDVTETVVDALIADEILMDCGWVSLSPGDSDAGYRDLRLVEYDSV